MRADPLFDDIPWEFITDDADNVIGTVYLLLPKPDPKRVKPTLPAPPAVRGMGEKGWCGEYS